MRNIFLPMIALILFTGLSAQTNPWIKHCESVQKQSNQIKDQNKKLDFILKELWTQAMKLNPELATFVGYPGLDDQWADQSLKAIQQRKDLADCHLKLINSVKEKSLKEINRINWRLAQRRIQQNIAGKEFNSEYLVLDQLGGPHVELADALLAAPSATIQDFENRLKRIESYPNLIDQSITLMEEGLKKKITPVKFLMEKVPAQIQSVITKDPKQSAVYKAFLSMPGHFSESDKSAILKRAQELIEQKVHPSLEKLKLFVETKYIPNCRTEISIANLPKGSAWYSYLIDHHTTTRLTAQEIHNIGLAEVKKINSEMDKIRSELNFKGSKSEFHKMLQTDKRFYFEDPKELISAYQLIAKQIDPELPKLFMELPRLTYGVRAMPDYKAKTAPTAYYMGGSIQSGRPGYFEANTYNLKSRPKWEMEVLTVHEAVPGHHFQIALAQELGELPEFRKNMHYTAFVEGWGLYSESLGDALGLYKDPYSKYGQLTYEMWRAVRLVVDTGMHSLGWDKKKALDYFMDNVPKDKLQSENEIDRYITWPGQALAYKIGELKFKELKAKAQTKLGDQFNIREFHREVLRHGALPLDVLETEFSAWLTDKQNLKLQ